ATKISDTWDAFRDAARRVTKWEGTSLLRAGFAVPQSTTGHDLFMVLHEQLGEHPFSADLSKPSCSGAVGQQALQLFVHLRNKDRVDGSDKPKPPPGLNALVAGVNAMQWDGP